MDTVAIATGLMRALERGEHGETIRNLFTHDASIVEHPNPVTPRGAHRDLEATLAGSTAGADLLAAQRYDVHEITIDGTLAIIRLTWSALVAHDAGPFTAGQKLTAHIAQFVTVEGDRIRSIETFDCYEPFQ